MGAAARDVGCSWDGFLISREGWAGRRGVLDVLGMGFGFGGKDGRGGVLALALGLGLGLEFGVFGGAGEGDYVADVGYAGYELDGALEA